VAITRTALGTASSKAATTSLTLTNVTLDEGDFLVVGVAYETDAAIDSVKWGGKELRLSKGQTQGDTRVRLYQKRIRKSATKDITITWAANMSARAMFAVKLTEVGRKDVEQGNSQTATTSPATGSAVTSTVADTISIAAFASLGPSGDTPGTAGAGHTLGQRDGTTGAPPASNVTIQETYEILSATGNVRATMTGATSRDWANVIVAYRASQTFTVDRALYVSHDAYPHAESVHLVIHDESGTGFTIVIPREDFENLTDAEVEDWIKRECVWWADKQIDQEVSPDFTPDATFNTRVASFVDDTFKV